MSQIFFEITDVEGITYTINKNHVLLIKDDLDPNFEKRTSITMALGPLVRHFYVAETYKDFISRFSLDDKAT